MGRRESRWQSGSNYYERRRESIERANQAKASKSDQQRRTQGDTGRVQETSQSELEWVVTDTVQDQVFYGSRYITFPVWTRRRDYGDRSSVPWVEPQANLSAAIRLFESGAPRVSAYLTSSKGYNSNQPAVYRNYICPRCNRDVRYYTPCRPDEYVPMSLDPSTVVDADP